MKADHVNLDPEQCEFQLVTLSGERAKAFDLLLPGVDKIRLTKLVEDYDERSLTEKIFTESEALYLLPGNRNQASEAMCFIYRGVL